MNKRIIHFLGIFLVVIGTSMVLPLIIALVYGEFRQAGAFLLSIVICTIPGFIVAKTYKTAVSDEKLSNNDGYFIVTAAWLLSSLFGALPYILTGVMPNFIDAFFESASGFTTTGATLFEDVEVLPHCILLWRSLTQWLGGMGMVVLFFAILPRFGAKANTIASAETPGAFQRKLTSKYSDTAKVFYSLYVFFTLVLTVLLLFGGMGVFDAFNHALTTLATGGFSTKNAGIGFYNSSFIYVVTGLFGFIAATNFGLFFDVITGNFKNAIKDEEFRSFVIIVAISSILITLSLKLTNTASNAVNDVTAAFFQVINTISTLGVETANSNWPPFCVIILALLMITGGCSSSTSGGIKVSRITTLFKVVRLEIKHRIHDSVVEDIKFNGKKIQSKTMDYILSFVVLYLVVVLSATVIICGFGGGDLMTNLISVLSCISNLGPGMDSLGLVCEYHTQSAICAITYTFVMIAGRLELSTFLVVFSRHFWNTNKV